MELINCLGKDFDESLDDTEEEENSFEENDDNVCKICTF